MRMCVHVTSNVELRNNVRLLLNVELRNYVISRQIVERRVTSECSKALVLTPFNTNIINYVYEKQNTKDSQLHKIK